ncbi:oxidoreductase [Aureococcus anophagefferens]|nr:oxidoreductase [Aureococcus anophagefferens]
MPQIAFGLYLIPKDEAGACVQAAVDAGYRHFDGAAFYDNEAAAAAALTPDCFYTSKVWTTDKTFDDAVRSVQRSAKELGRPLDLAPVGALVHWPVPGHHLEQYRALVHCRDELKIVKRCGLSNYTPEDYEELMASGVATGAPPCVNQIEVSPFLYRKECVDYFQSKGLVVQAFKPLQRGAALGNETVGALASKLGVSAAQVLIRWGVQKRLNVCVKSANRAASGRTSAWRASKPNDGALDALTTPAAIDAWRALRSGGQPWGDGPARGLGLSYYFRRTNVRVPPVAASTCVNSSPVASSMAAVGFVVPERSRAGPGPL